ncbi:hypothetical protein C6P40_005383, partial [Pichia californica]
NNNNNINNNNNNNNGNNTNNAPIINQNCQTYQTQWNIEEDNLIRSRNIKKLTIVELSILLPNKSTTEIESRINFLERKRLTISSLLSDYSDSDADANSNISTPTRRSSFSSNNSIIYTTSVTSSKPNPVFEQNEISSSYSSSVSFSNSYNHHNENFQTHKQISNMIVLPPIRLNQN